MTKHGVILLLISFHQKRFLSTSFAPLNGLNRQLICLRTFIHPKCDHVGRDNDIPSCQKQVLILLRIATLGTADSKVAFVVTLQDPKRNSLASLTSPHEKTYPKILTLVQLLPGYQILPISKRDNPEWGLSSVGGKRACLRYDVGPKNQTNGENFSRAFSLCQRFCRRFVLWSEKVRNYPPWMDSANKLLSMPGQWESTPSCYLVSWDSVVVHQTVSQ